MSIPACCLSIALRLQEHFFSISLPASPRYKAIVELEAGSNQVIVQEIYHLAEDGEGRWVEWEFSALDKTTYRQPAKMYPMKAVAETNAGTNR